MHTESFQSTKLSCELDVSSTPNNTSILEDDLALSSSTLGQQDKSLQEQSEVTSRLCHTAASVVYVNEDTMDCSYSEKAETLKNCDSRNEISSPEMFESDDDDDDNESRKKDFSELLTDERDKSSLNISSMTEKSVKPTDIELIIKSDCYLLARMNKFLTGVPPPPKHTICQSDCADLLSSIRANRHYFLVDPLDTVNEKTETTTRDDETVRNNAIAVEMTEEILQNSTQERSFNNHRGKSSLRNLTNAFDACDRNDEATRIVNDTTRENFSDNSNDCRTSAESTSNDDVDKEMRKTDEINREISTEVVIGKVATNEITTERDRTKHVTFKIPDDEPLPFFNTINVEDVKNISWELAYKHKTHGIYYNRSKTMEEFENLRLKLCQRYIGAETQSSCNIWFTKQAPGSVKKRNLLSRRSNGQSPGKRLSHLARRRRTFSSANLQGLGMVDKKQLVLNIKKPTIRKGKSPRGKSPRGSAKKRAALSRISPSPRKAKLETSKRALFQSPPNDRAGTSNRTTTTSLLNTNSQHKIKRALFPTVKTNDEMSAIPATNVSDIKRVLTFEETKKRKSDEELEGPRFKWAKSLSFDCAHVHESNSVDSWTNERHSTGHFHMKSETTLQQGKSELSETHRKKLLWAVAEALRGKGIGMGHPRFKQCASQLARIVKKYMPDLENPNLPRKPGSTSDRMLRLAKRHVILIVESRSTE